MKSMRWLVVALAVLTIGCSRFRTDGGVGSPAAGVGASGTGVQEIAVGAGQACVRMANASVFCWGSNRLGSVGVKGPSPREQFHTLPVRVGDVRAKRLLLVGVKSCFEPSEGSAGLLCWGGSLSNSDAYARPMMGVSPGRWVASESTGCVISSEGRATCWGENTSGRLSPGDEAAVSELFGKEQPPRVLEVGAPVLAVAIGGRHGCALRRDNRVSCWGLNNFGQLGVEAPLVASRATPAVIEGLDNVVSVASGFFHTCALRGDGTVWCWGRGDNGQLGSGEGALVGEGERRHRGSPSQVKGLRDAAQIVAASSETCAITKQSELWCWGQNDHGQIGNGTSQDRFEPVKVGSLEGVTQVAIGYAMACAVARGGEAFCWGDNEDGMLGNGSIELSAIPSRVRLPEATPPPSVAQPARVTEPMTRESLACGFRFRAPGRRLYRHLDDLEVDRIAIEQADTAISAFCTRRESQADQEPDALARRIAEGSSNSATSQRRRVGQADCLDFASTGSRTLFCYTSDFFVSLSVRSTDPSLVEAVISSFEPFDRKAGFAAPPPATEPAPPGMASIAGGEFPMGCANESLFRKPVGELGCIDDSQPLHRVRLSPFAIDRTEVSWADYQACVQASRCTPTGDPRFTRPEKHPSQPVRYVSWVQASAYCRWRGKRLPTEAEWERAARGTDFRTRPWGDELADCSRAQLLSCPGGGPIDVGQRPDGASPDGVLDLAGNVKEWVADAFAKTYYLESPALDPAGPPGDAIQRAVRGGSFMTDAGSESVSFRYGREPSFQSDELGFRCAISLGAAAQAPAERTESSTGP